MLLARRQALDEVVLSSSASSSERVAVTSIEATLREHHLDARALARFLEVRADALAEVAARPT